LIPHDGLTLASSLDQIKRLTGRTPDHVYVDKGYRGHGCEGRAAGTSEYQYCIPYDLAGTCGDAQSSLFDDSMCCRGPMC